jgi:hypothetical protein
MIRRSLDKPFLCGRIEESLGERKMNDDMVLFVMLGCVSVVAVASYIYFHIYRGVHGSLAAARIGDVYNFRYVQPLTGTYERYLAKVVNVCKLDKGNIDYLNRNSKYRRYDDMFERSNTLVTCVMKDGSFRQFYGERCDYVRRPLIGGLLFKAGVAHLF